MNEAIPEPNIQQPITDPVQAEKSLSNRILGYAFLASVLINIGWVTWVANSNIFGGSSALIPLKETKIKVFHPIPQPPKPKPPKVLPPPPPPKQQPQVKPPPLQISHPQPHPPVPTHQFKVATTNAPHTTTNFTMPSAPDTAAPTTPTMPSDSGPDVKAPPPQVESQPGPEVVAPPTKAVEQPKQEAPPPPPVVHHPDNWVPIDSQDASFPDNIGNNVSVDGIDGGSITNPKVVISFTIDENGRAKNVHVTESCGNTELDNRFVDAIRRARGVPAIQDHIPRDAPESLSFDVGN